MQNHSDHSLDDVENLLRKVLGAKLEEVLDLVNADAHTYMIQIPDAETVDWSLEELASLVARSSNAYGRIARLAGMARAESKLAKGRYDRKFKTSRSDGKNAEEREANAISASETEHIAMTVADAVASMLDSLENGARVASESARKIYDKVTSMYIAQNRQSAGTLRDSDFTSSRYTSQDFSRWD